jgi:hypothetical protein
MNFREILRAKVHMGFSFFQIAKIPGGIIPQKV